MSWMNIDQQSIRFRHFIKPDYVELIWKREFAHMEKNAILPMGLLTFLMI